MKRLIVLAAFATAFSLPVSVHASEADHVGPFCFNGPSDLFTEGGVDSEPFLVAAARWQLRFNAIDHSHTDSVVIVDGTAGFLQVLVYGGHDCDFIGEADGFERPLRVQTNGETSLRIHVIGDAPDTSSIRVEEEIAGAKVSATVEAPRPPATAGVVMLLGSAA